MQKKRSPFIALGISAVVAVICLIAALGLLYTSLDRVDSQADYSDGIDRPAPDFSLVSLNGADVSLRALRGKPVLLNFWATWCDPCIAEMPLLEKTAQRYAKELIVIGVNEGDRRTDIEELISQELISYTILLDTDESVGAAYNLHGYPTSIFIDADGIIRTIYLGEIPASQLEKNLRLIGIQ